MNRLLLMTLLPATLLTGCESRLTGNEGNFQFQYPADDRLLDFNKPLAVGARLDMEVVDVGQLRPVELLAASSADPEIIEVVDFAGHQLTIEGISDGNALLEVEGTTAGGETLTDSVNFNARVPEVHLLRHTCGTLGSQGQAYLTGQRIWVPFELQMSNGQPVIGYGYYPVSSSGTGTSLDVGASGQQYMAFDTTTAESVTLTSDLDGSTLSLEIVDAGDIDGVEQPIAFVLEDIDVGDTNPFYVLPRSGGLTVCQANVDVDVTSDTPEICTLTRSADAPTGADGGREHELGWFEVTGVAEGTCSYTVTYPDGDGGAGVSAQFSFPIEP